MQFLFERRKVQLLLSVPINLPCKCESYTLKESSSLRGFCFHKGNKKIIIFLSQTICLFLHILFYLFEITANEEVKFIYTVFLFLSWCKLTLCFNLCVDGTHGIRRFITRDILLVIGEMKGHWVLNRMPLASSFWETGLNFICFSASARRCVLFDVQFVGTDGQLLLNHCGNYHSDVASVDKSTVRLC